jgi:HEAT repeat protein
MHGGVMKHARYIVIAIVAVSFGAAAAPKETKNDEAWQKAKQTYIELLSYNNAGVRASAANYIRKYDIVEAKDALKEALACDNCETVKIAAALALIHVAGDEGLTIIKEAMATEENEMVTAFYRSVLGDDAESELVPISER